MLSPLTPSVLNTILVQTFPQEAIAESDCGGTGSPTLVPGLVKLLIEAGAQKIGVPAKECEAQNGHVVHLQSSRKLSYGQLAEAASRLKPPSSPILKSKDRYRFVGKPMPRLDIPVKVNGSAIYGTDVRLPGMCYAAVSQSPVFGGEVKAYDKAAAMAVRGVESVIPIPHGMSVVADSTWHGQKGLEALNVQFVGEGECWIRPRRAWPSVSGIFGRYGKDQIEQ